MNRKSANTWLTDMINISIESFKLLLNEINQIENKNSFIIIREDALLSKGESNEEMGVRIIIWFFIFATENTSLLVNNSNISLLFPPDTLMVITFAGVYGKLYCVYLKQNSSAALTALCCCWTLNTETLLTVTAARSRVVSTSAAIFFITNWWMSKSLKVWIMTWKLARSKPGRGRAEMQGSSVPLGRNYVSPSGGPLPSWALRIVLTFPPFTAPLCVCVCSHVWERETWSHHNRSLLANTYELHTRTLLTVFTFILKAKTRDYGKGRYISDSSLWCSANYNALGQLANQSRLCLSEGGNL